MPITAQDHLALATAAVTLWQHHHTTVKRLQEDIEAVIAGQLTIDDVANRLPLHAVPPAHLIELLDLAKITQADYSKRMKAINIKRRQAARRSGRKEAPAPAPGRIPQLTRQDFLTPPPEPYRAPAPAKLTPTATATLESITRQLVDHCAQPGGILEGDLLSTIMELGYKDFYEAALSAALTSGAIIDTAPADEESRFTIPDPLANLE